MKTKNVGTHNIGRYTRYLLIIILCNILNFIPLRLITVVIDYLLSYIHTFFYFTSAGLNNSRTIIECDERKKDIFLKKEEASQWRNWEKLMFN